MTTVDEPIVLDLTPPKIVKVRVIAPAKSNSLRDGETLNVGDELELPYTDFQRWERRGVVVRI